MRWPNINAQSSFHGIPPGRAARRRARPTYVTTKQFLLQFGFNSLRGLPDAEALEDELAFEGKAAGGRLAGGAR
jgi:hypothetical protein